MALRLVGKGAYADGGGLDVVPGDLLRALGWMGGDEGLGEAGPHLAVPGHHRPEGPVDTGMHLVPVLAELGLERLHPDQQHGPLAPRGFSRLEGPADPGGQGTPLPVLHRQHGSVILSAYHPSASLSAYFK